MITRKMEEKFDELKNYFNEKLSSQEQSLISTFNNLISDLKAEISKEIKSEVLKQNEKLESQNKMLQQQISELRQVNIENQMKNEELEQYGRRLCIRIEGVEVKSKETSDDVLQLVKKLFETAEVNVPDAVIDRAHRIGPVYKNRDTNKLSKSIIVRFTTFRHRTMFYRARSKLKGIKVRLDLTKSRYDLLNKANEHVRDIPTIKFCYVDVNCRLKVRFASENQQDEFFSSMEELRDIADLEI